MRAYKESWVDGWRRCLQGIALVPLIVVLSACGGGGGSGSGNGGGEDGPPAFVTGQNASVVIGQPDFTTGTGVEPSAQSVWLPDGSAAVDADGKLYLMDGGNRRVLAFNSIPSVNHAAADFALGQSNFELGGGSGLSSIAFTDPRKMVFSGTQALLLDSNNHRILIWNAIPNDWEDAANVVVGQPDMDTDASGAGTTGLNNPHGMAVSDGKLIVADGDNNRVLVWNALPTANQAAADLVLGQADFASTAANRGGAVAGNTLQFPSGVWSDGTRLMVVDSANHRVLVWDTLPTENGQSADWALGQADLVSAGSGTTAGRFNLPYTLTTDGTQLAVADFSNRRACYGTPCPPRILLRMW